MAQIQTAPNGNYTHYLDVYDTGQTRNNNDRLIHFRYYVDMRISGQYGSWTGSDKRTFRVTVNGQDFDNRTSFDTRNGQDLVPVEGDVWIGVGTSDWNIPFSLYFEGWSVSFPGAYASGSLPLSRIALVPNQPNTPSISNVSPVGMTLSWNLPANNGAGLDQMLLRRYDDASLTGYTDYVNGGSVTSRTITGLNPGTRYWWAVFAHNAVGYSTGSGVASATTIPSSAPGLTVTASLDGRSANLVMTAPGGVSGVSYYNIEYRIGTAGASTATTSASTTATVSGLTPGQVYQWRASAVIGGYTSPWSTWTPVNQPNPNTNPGDYFDGNTTARPDTTFSWTGTANNSTSISTGLGVKGWVVEVTGSTAATLNRVSGGAYGLYSARVQITRDCTTAGQVIAGQSNTSPYASAVQGDTVYTSSIHVRPSRSQRLAAMVRWYTTGGAFISSALGGDSIIIPDEYGRISVTARSPFNAAFAVVRVVDVAGTGWSAWLGGDSFVLDGAMVMLGAELLPYFDGSTPDTADFRYDWLGTTNESTSSRTTLINLGVDPLLDPDCPPMPSPPLPPSIPSECIDEVGSWRRYMVQVPGNEVPLWGSTVPTLVMNTGLVAERQVRIRVFPNPDGVAPEQVDTSLWDAELILTYVPPKTQITMDGVTQRVWAEVNGGDPITADQLLYGTNGVPATWPVFDCGIGYVVTLDVPLDAPSGNLTTELLLTQRV